METLMDTQKKIREHISALSDGELSASDLELAFAALRVADGKQAWNTYYRIGDVLRAQGSPDLSDAFTLRLSARLAAEPAHTGRDASVPLQPGSAGTVGAAEQAPAAPAVSAGSAATIAATS